MPRNNLGSFKGQGAFTRWHSMNPVFKKAIIFGPRTWICGAELNSGVGKGVTVGISG